MLRRHDPQRTRRSSLTRRSHSDRPAGSPTKGPAPPIPRALPRAEISPFSTPPPHQGDRSCTGRRFTHTWTAPRHQTLEVRLCRRPRSVSARGGAHMDESARSTRREELPVGARVDVHTRYVLGRWAPGFTIAEVRADGYGIRRCSDGSVLQETIHPDEVRAVTPTPARSQDAHPTTSAREGQDPRSSPVRRSEAER